MRAEVRLRQGLKATRQAAGQQEPGRFRQADLRAGLRVRSLQFCQSPALGAQIICSQQLYHTRNLPDMFYKRSLVDAVLRRGYDVVAFARAGAASAVGLELSKTAVRDLSTFHPCAAAQRMNSGGVNKDHGS